MPEHIRKQSPGNHFYPVNKDLLKFASLKSLHICVMATAVVI